jgi:carbonic anhydrase
MNYMRKLCLLPVLALSISFSLAAYLSRPSIASAQAEAPSAASAAEAGAPAAEAGPDCAKEPFTYDNGPLGQRYWCGACNLATSKLQAPINIDSRNARPDGSLPSINFSGYRTTKLVVYENVNNLKVDYKNGESFIAIGSEKFKLMEFHFHRPGEEAIDNHRPAMVLHLVHANADASAFVAIAVLIEEGTPTPKTKALVDKLIQHFPPPAGLQEIDINAADLLPADSFPENRSYFRYRGSLTTPACGENVTFYVLKTPIRFSSEQLEQFERRYPFPNSRNIQNTNGRQVVQTTQ